MTDCWISATRSPGTSSSYHPRLFWRMFKPTSHKSPESSSDLEYARDRAENEFSRPDPSGGGPSLIVADPSKEAKGVSPIQAPAKNSRPVLLRLFWSFEPS